MRVSRGLSVLATALVIAGLLAPATVRADVAPDGLDSYTIAITPQSDGMLTMDYTLNGYHAMSDWPANEPYLQVGVPNGSFTIDTSGFSGQVAVSNVEVVDNGGSFVQFDFGTLPRTGDVFNLSFSITQGAMAYPDTGNGEVTYEFMPAAWTFPITVSQLTVLWTNPSDPSLLKFAQPAPTYGGEAMSWQWQHPSIDGSGMFGDDEISLAYDQSAFTLSDAATAQTDSGNGGFSSGGSSGSTSMVGGFLVVVVFLGIVWTLSWVVSGDNYRGGPGVRPVRAGFFGGGFGGGGCACACAGCACACACAGGGRVGCSRKAIGIACLTKVIRSMTKNGEASPGDSRE